MKKGFGWFFIILGGLNVFRGLMMIGEGMNMGGGVLFWGVGFIVLGYWMISSTKSKPPKEKF